MKYFWPALLWASISSAQTRQFEVVRVYYNDLEQARSVANDLGAWTFDKDNNYFLVDVDSAGRDLLEASGFRLVVDQKLTESYRNPPEILGQASGIPGYPCYRTVEETLDRAMELASLFSNLAQWQEIGSSWERTQSVTNGYPLIVLRITNEAIPGPKPKLFAMSAIHAREYATAELNTRFAEYLLQNYGTDPDATWLVDHREIHLLLQTNPDGRKHAEGGDLWRKNTNSGFCASPGSYGIDLNRNFSFNWGCCSGSSSDPCSDTYRGPQATSEPEAYAVETYARQIFPDQRGPNLSDPAPPDASGVFIDIHSYSQLVLFAWGHVSTPAPNGDALQTLGRKFAYHNRYEAKPSIGLYPTDGTTGDFAYGELGVASYTFELGTSFFQNCATFEEVILPDNLAALVYAAKAAETPYLTPSGPDVTQPIAVVDNDRVTVTATANDDRFYTAGLGTEAVQAIAQVRYYFNEYPSQALAAPTDMSPVDGVFDQVEEAVSANFQLTHGPGKYPLYLQARDTGNNWGALTATWLYVPDPETFFEGFVLEEGSGLPLTATVSTAGYQTATDPQTGYYQLQVNPGNFDIKVIAMDHADGFANGQAISLDQTVNLDFSLPVICSFFVDDGESGEGDWLAEGSWALSNEESVSGAFAWSDSPGGEYGNNVNVSLTSGTVDLSQSEALFISFNHTYNLESGYDYGYLEYRIGAGAWVNVATFNGVASWQGFEREIPDLAGKSEVHLRFRLDTDNSITRDGWHIDDITFRGTGSCNEPVNLSAMIVAWPQYSVLDMIPLIE